MKAIWLVMLLAITVAACQQSQAPSSAQAPTAVESAQSSPDEIQVSTELKSRLRMVTLTDGEVAEPIRFPATVQVDEHRVARVGSAVTGRVAEIKAFVGQLVQRDQALATINSKELSEAQLAYLKASSGRELYRKSFERARHLFDSGVISTFEFQKRETEFLHAEVELQAAADQLVILGMNASEIAELGKHRAIRSISSVVTSIAGTVIGRSITLGQVVQPSDVLFTVADLSHVWLVADAPEQQAEFLREGMAAEAEVPALGDRRIVGHIIYVSRVLDPESRTVTVRMEVANPEGKLKPEMLATFLIKKPAQSGLTVPAKAVIRQGDGDFVFVAADSERFRLRPVQLGPDNGGVRHVVKGLKAGESVVVDGAFHLNNERLRKDLE